MAAVIALLLAAVAPVPSGQLPGAQDVPPEVAQGAGPRGTSGELHEDGVGYATLLATPPEGRWADVAIGVGHPTLPPGTAVELTALDTGRTIVALVVAPSYGSVVALSPGAAQALGVGDRAAVRVRTVVTAPQDLQALRAGQAASPRLDAPTTLITALRRKLPQDRALASQDRRAGPRPVASRGAAAPSTALPRASVRPVPTRPVSTLQVPALPVAVEAAPPPAPAVLRPVRPKPVPQPVAPARGALVVQVAALSAPDRAAALARQLGGRVVPIGKLYRVQLGPFADAASAQRARDGAARRGYADARISHTD